MFTLSKSFSHQTIRHRLFTQKSFNKLILDLDLYNIKLPHQIVKKPDHIPITYLANFNKRRYQRNGARIQFDILKLYQSKPPKHLNNLFIDNIIINKDNQVILVKLAEKRHLADQICTWAINLVILMFSSLIMFVFGLLFGALINYFD
jgi:uncharacterized short protein YbdD (DUF466 family)